MPNETFAIYRSSAGSGKTHQLALEFVALAVDNPNLFNKILAVTFTNKATKEMKERILSFLIKLANNDDEELLTQVKEIAKLPTDTISNNAQIVLGKILHQYSNFSINTIDAFFQKIVKSFAKELGLMGNFKVELDQDKVKLEIIDQIIDELEEDKELTDWLVGFSFSKIEENKSWNIYRQIEPLASDVFKEFFRPIEKDLQKIDRKLFRSFLEQIRIIKIDFESFMKSKAISALELIKYHGLEVEDFSGKARGPAGYFNRIINKKDFDPKKLVLGVCENPDKWSAKTSPIKTEIQKVVEAGLQEITISIVEHYHQHTQEYTTTIEVLKNFYVLGILSQITKKLKKYRHENDVMLISDIPVFLSEIIADNEAPFIYEKTGTWYQHFLIDEFQDTSEFQWKNFRPLVENGLSQDNKSLLVGDGKQSIYRWRGGDWNLILHKVNQDLSLYNPADKHLNTNWRSARKIVEFNNKAFNYFPNLIDDDIKVKIEGSALLEKEKDMLKSMSSDVKQLYEDVTQKIAGKNLEPSKGNIVINVYKKNSAATEPWKENVLKVLPIEIEQLQDAGFEARDIAILVRNSKEGKQIMERLIIYKNSSDARDGYSYDAISSESLLLGNSTVIRLLINTIKYGLNSDDNISLAEICFNYDQLNNGKNTNYIQHDLQYILEKEKLPKAFLEEAELLVRLPVYELVERTIQIFNLGHAKNKGYLQAFQDIILEYFSNDSKDVNDFLLWWDDKGKRKSIQFPEAVNAIRVMTIHKSKGLEFKAVLVPFCDWMLDLDSRKNNFLWCKTDHKPFNDIGYLPVKYSSRLKDSLFARDYFEEMIKAYIDNLNLLYVALTRAEEFLLINCPPPSKELKNAGDLIINFMNKIIQESEGDGSSFSMNEQDDVKKYAIGALENNFQKVSSAQKASTPKYRTSDWRQKIAIRKKGSLLFGPEGSELKAKINYGILVHEILASIQNETEADSSVENLYRDGQLSSHERQTLKDQLNKIFANPQIQGWFNTNWEVKTEIQIIVKNARPKRPDRVLLNGKNAIIIDFKTGNTKPMDNSQILEYRALLGEMGYSNVEAYLLYISLDKIIKVA